MRSGGALDTCEGTTGDAAGSAFTLKGNAVFEGGGIAGEPDGFTLDTVADFFLAFGF